MTYAQFKAMRCQSRQGESRQLKSLLRQFSIPFCFGNCLQFIAPHKCYQCASTLTHPPTPHTQLSTHSSRCSPECRMHFCRTLAHRQQERQQIAHIIRQQQHNHFAQTVEQTERKRGGGMEREWGRYRRCWESVDCCYKHNRCLLATAAAATSSSSCFAFPFAFLKR